MQVFDPAEEYSVVQRRLPHWSQVGTLSCITWRTCDSIPKAVLERWLAERSNRLRQCGIDATRPDWRARVNLLEAAQRKQFHAFLADRWNKQLDACHGKCVRKQPLIAKIVENSLIRFDGERYELTDFVIMPNHVHVLVTFPDEESMLKQSDSWKHFTATRINEALGCKGRFWQQDEFDHLVRSVEQFKYLRHYIADNPRRANLHSGEFIHWSKPM